MSNCEKHKKEVAGITDMKELAEKVGDLHYDTLRHFMFELHQKIGGDSDKDRAAGKEKLASHLHDAAGHLAKAYLSISEAWKTSEPFMTLKNPTGHEYKDR